MATVPEDLDINNNLVRSRIKFLFDKSGVYSLKALVRAVLNMELLKEGNVTF